MYFVWDRGVCSWQVNIVLFLIEPKKEDSGIVRYAGPFWDGKPLSGMSLGETSKDVTFSYS